MCFEEELIEKKLKRRKRKRKNSEEADEVTPKNEENGDFKPDSHLDSLEGLSKMVILVHTCLFF